MNIRSTSLLFGACVCLTSSACKKTIENWKDEKAPTVYDTLTTLADSRIIKMEVMNTGDDQILGAINDSNKTITLYLPYYYELQFMEVNLTLPPDAAVSPAADELIPVFGDTTFKYTVTGKSGSKSVYTIRPIVQQQNFMLNEISSEGATKTIDISSGDIMFSVTGMNIIPSYAVTSLHLTDTNGSEVRKLAEWNGSGGNNSSYMEFEIKPADTSIIKTDTDYWVEMHCYSLKYKMQYPIRFSK